MDFNLQRNIQNWLISIKEEPSITESDSEELKSHLLDLIDNLKQKGLDEEEAFYIAKKRLGGTLDWGEEFQKGNNQVIQMRRSLIILAGVLAYFFIYYFINFTSKLLFIIVAIRSNDLIAIEWILRYLILWHFLFILFFTSIYFIEKKTITIIENIRLTPIYSIVLLLITAAFAITDTCLYPIVKNMIGENYSLKSHLYHYYIYFNYSFPLVVSLGFILIFYNYYKKTKF